MKLLLDSHIILWWLSSPAKLRKPALAALAAEETELYVSAASWWELAIKRSLGRLRFDMADILVKLARGRVNKLDVTFAHAERAANLPLHHSDPFDRMLAAQALCEQFVVVTRDKAFEGYGVPVLQG